METSIENPLLTKTEVPLAKYTSIRLGGNAKYLVSCRTIDEIRAALELSRRENLRVQILGGGSNTVFPDEGFDGLVIKIDLKGIDIEEAKGRTIIHAAAGEDWDDLVKFCVARELAGVECLSGIPGLVGATPIQNVGAYGQEVKDTILHLKAIDRASLELKEFNADECSFGYRKSMFKSNDQYVIVDVAYRLVKSGKPVIRYAELQEYIKSNKRSQETETRCSKLETVRNAVLALRRKKSMLIDDNDPNSRSVGSFFVNPILSEGEFEEFRKRVMLIGNARAPSYKGAEGIKIPAAWLIENSGFRKGYRTGGVGISSNHSLALVNYSGTTKELLALASDIEREVWEKFGVKLEREAVIVQH